MLQRLKAWLLDLANADPPPVGREQFYALKSRLLHKYGTLVGWDNQEITQRCWGEWAKGCSPHCSRCYGTGIYSQRWWSLERWEWCGRTFHRPTRQIWQKPETVQINGRIQHPHTGRIHLEALLWLYLLCGEWRLLWHQLNGSYAYGWYLWPLANLQRLLTGGRLKINSWKWRIRQWWHKRKPAEAESDDTPF